MARVRPGIGWSVVGARRACSRMWGRVRGDIHSGPGKRILAWFRLPAPGADSGNPDDYSFWADMYWS